MYLLHHYFLCASSRFVRLILDEYKLSYRLQNENFWEPQKNFLMKNPGGYFPILVDASNNCHIVGSSVCLEYLGEKYDENKFLPNCYQTRAEIRRIVYWIENIFNKEVLNPLLKEKIYKRFDESLNSDTDIIRNSLSHLKFHLGYFNHLMQNQDWIVGEKVSYADLCVASSLSVLDYLGELNFNKNEKIKDLYFKVKSRPSFKNILKDKIVGINPSKNYLNFDI